MLRRKSKKKWLGRTLGRFRISSCESVEICTEYIPECELAEGERKNA